MAYRHVEHCDTSTHEIPLEGEEDLGCTKILTSGHASAWLRWRPGGAPEGGVDPAGPLTPEEMSRLGVYLVQLAQLAGIPIPAIPALA